MLYTQLLMVQLILLAIVLVILGVYAFFHHKKIKKIKKNPISKNNRIMGFVCFFLGIIAIFIPIGSPIVSVLIMFLLFYTVYKTLLEKENLSEVEFILMIIICLWVLCVAWSVVYFIINPSAIPLT